MKYKVIGWTYYESLDLKVSNKKIGYAERNAIIDDIRKNKYLFSGWHHQESSENCVPILNDGKARLFSQRGWGGVMAEAYGYMNEMDYSIFTFRESIVKDRLVFPKTVRNMSSLISKHIENECFNVDVNEGLFEFASKNNPFYLDDLDSLRYIDEDDLIILHYNGKKLCFLVKGITRNKKEIDFEDSELINTKYKIIVKHISMPLYD